MSRTRLLEFPGVVSVGAPSATNFGPPTINTPPAADAAINMNPALWTLANVHYRRPWAPARLLNVAAESAYLLACLDHRPGSELAWTSFGMAAPPHLSRFLSESLGMAVCLEIAHQRYGWRPWRDAMVNVDEIDDPAIKETLTPRRSTSPDLVRIVTSRGGSWYRPSPGARPDFAFLIPGLGLIGAEARGRARLSVQYPTAEQQRRCADLAEWSRRAGGWQWFMSWAEASGTESQVTVFDPGEPLPLSRRVATMGARVEKARYDYMYETAASDELQNFRVNGAGFHLTSLRLPAAPIDGPEWLTVAVSDRRLIDARADEGFAATPDRPFDLAAPLIAVASTPRMVTLLTDQPPTADVIIGILNEAARPN